MPNEKIEIKESHSQPITFKTTPSQKDFIIKTSALMGLDVSEFCRNAVLIKAISLNQSIGQPQPKIYPLPVHQLPPPAVEPTVHPLPPIAPLPTLTKKKPFTYGKTVTVCGTVSGVHSGSTTYINFDKPYPDQTFTAVIFSSSLDAEDN